MSDFITIANKTYTPNGANTIVQFDLCFAAAQIGASKVSGAVIDLDYQYSSVSASQVTNPTFSYTDTFGDQTARVWSDPPTVNLSGTLPNGALPNGKIALVADPALLSLNPIIGTGGKVLTVKLVVSGSVTDFAVSLQSYASGGDNYITTADAVKHDLDGGAFPNLNPPVWANDSVSSFSLAENAASGVMIGAIAHATDADVGDTVTYTLVDPPSVSGNALFSIDSSSGQISLTAAGAAAIDYESSTKSYSLTVQASDGSASHHPTATVVVNLTNVNDNSPVFSVDNATLSLAENASAGAIEHAVAHATDADGDTVTYSLLNVPTVNGNALFSIDSSTGQVSLTAAGATAIDYESSIKSYTLTVQASDGLTAHNKTATATVNLTNVNDNSPMLTVEHASVSLPENASAGAISGAVAHATDADGDTLTFSLVNPPTDGSNQPIFTIDAITGQISLTSVGAASIDFENPDRNHATLTVKVSDGLVAHDQTTTIDLSLTNVNDNAPVFSSGTTGSVDENAPTTTVIYTAITTDADNLGAPTYTLGGADAALLNINANTGTVTLKTSANFEVKPLYSFDVLANDGAHTVSQSVVVSVNNVNDAPTGIVTITGTVTEREILTAHNTLVDEDGIIGNITYQWQLSSNGTDWNNINGATSNTYTLTEAEVGKNLKVVASYTDGLTTVVHVPSAATGAVANVNDAPTGTVTISGSATQGQTLTANNTLADLDGLGTITYQWQAGGSAINGATSSTYTLTQAEVGKTVTVVASYTDGHGTAEHVTSTATGIVANVNDAPTGSVVITGTASRGALLTADTSALHDADGLGTLNYQWKADDANIANAISNTYILTAAEVGKKITVVVSYTDGYGASESLPSSATTAVSEHQNNLPTGSVTITGTATQNAVLTASNDLADLDGLGPISYQWKAAGNAISGATGNTYTLTEAEVGKVVTVVASYTDLFGVLESKASSATSAVLNVNDAPTGSVTITGTATQNAVLTASNDLADPDGLGTVSYQWKAGGSDISGATGITYTLTEAEVGKTVTVVASYTDGHGTAEHVASAATAAVANVNDAPTGSVIITGTATQNAILTASNTLADLDGLGTIHYQWQAAGSDISGATSSTYTLTEAEVGKTVTVVASYTDGHSTAEHVASSATAAVMNVNDAPTGSVTIDGTATQGQQLTASNTLADADGLGSISYQWKAGGSDISGATGSTYTLTEAEVGKSVTVVASYTDGHSTAEHVSSLATAAVMNVNDAPTGSVTITGTATQGQTLTAISTLADEDGLGTISYQWTADEVNIAGATGTTLLLGAAQTGKAIRVQANYVDGHDTAEHVVSSATSAVVGTQSGSVQDGYLSHALVWVDSTPNGVRDWTDGNSNGTWDSGEGESWVLTDTTGQFTGLVGTGTIRITANPANPSGTIDISTGKAFTGSYSAPSGSTVVNPLTTLVVAAGGDESKVKTALGLDASLDLSTYDPLAEANKTEASGADLATAITVQSAATQVANIMDIAESVATGAGAASTAGVAASVATALMTAAAGGTVNLTNSSVISGAITDAANNAGATTTGLTTVIDAVSASSAAVNSQIADVSTAAKTEANAGRTVNAENSLEQVVAAQIVAQETVAVQAKTAATDNSTAGLTITSSSVTAALDTAKSQVQTIFTNHAPTGDVTMTGTATQGQTLTEKNTLADTDGLGTISYQWQSDGENISGATCETLLLGDAQVGHQVRVVASYTDGAGNSESVNSNAATILSQHAPTGSVTITGTVANGNILTASNTLADLDSLGIISYQWYLGSDAISGATTNTWLANNLNPGDAISVKASYTDGHGTLESVSSDALHQPATNSNDLQTELAAYISNFTPADKSSAEAGISSYFGSLPSETSVSVVSRDYSAQPEGSSFTITSSGHEALNIVLPDNSTLTLDNAEFAIISGNNITIRGGAGNNIVFAGSGHQDIVLGIGDDIIHGGADGDYIGSLAGNDQLYGDAGNDTLSGGADNDTLTGGTGDDTLDGGTGDDTAVFSHDFSKYTISFDGTHYTIKDTTTTDSDGTDLVSGVEHFQFADVMKDVNALITTGADPYAHHEFLGMDGGETALVGLAGAGILAWVVPMIF